MSDTTSMKTIEYRYLPKLRGETLSFETSSLSHVGTYGCKTEVGIYFPVRVVDRTAAALHCRTCNGYFRSKQAWLRHNHVFDATTQEAGTNSKVPPGPENPSPRCFVANISASNLLDVKGGPRHTGNAVPNEAGRAFKQQVLEQLKSEADAQDWLPSDVDTSRMVIVCPEYYLTPDHTWTSDEYLSMSGQWIVEALRDFLGLATTTTVDTASEGFIIDHAGDGSIVKVPKDTTDARYLAEDRLVDVWRGPEGEARRKYVQSIEPERSEEGNCRWDFVYEWFD